ncbi:MAG: tRNA pseudouridine(55) synthase TruB [Methyloligellaceae bacterium]
MRRRKGLPIHGWLILDKPAGLTSTRAVSRVKRALNANKAGHAGTLDPLATGILPIALGEATKTVPYVVDGKKGYRFTVRWGAETDTDDLEGKIINQSDNRPELSSIESVLDRFTGTISQVPPLFSAIKVQGERAYDLARDGAQFELEARSVEIESLKITGVPDQDHCELEALCGKGTYVRALARDIGRCLGVYGHIVSLRRTQVGTFFEADTISLDKLEELSHSAGDQEELMSLMKPVETALDDIPALAIDTSDAMRLKRGQAILLRGRDAPIIKGVVYATSRGSLIALGEIQQGQLRPTRVFNLPG